MEIFFRCAAVVMVAAIVCTFLRKTAGDFALLVSTACVCCVFLCSFRFLEPVMDYIRELRGNIGISDDLTLILIKTAGLGIAAEITAAICEDAGEHALGRAVGYCGNIAVLWLALPLLQTVMGLITDLLAE